MAARSLVDQALETWLEIGHKYLITTGLYWSGKVALRERDLSLATARFKEGLRVAIELESNQGIAEFLVTLGEVAASSGDPEEAARLFGGAENYVRREGGNLSSLSADDLDLNDALAEVRGSLGDELFNRAWGEGTGITPESLLIT